MTIVSDDGAARSVPLHGPEPSLPQGLAVRTRHSGAMRAASRPESRVAVDSWENEGGNLPVLPGAPGKTRAAATPAPQLAAMQTRFEADVSNGLVGRYHNTFEHRSRVLRQLTEASHIRNFRPQP